MATSKIQTGLRINEATYDKLCILSKRESRSLNNLVEYMIQQYLEKYESEHGVIRNPDAE